MKRIAIIGEYDETFEPHPATNAAIGHSARQMDVEVDADWVSTEGLELADLSAYAGFWIAPGSPYKDLERTVEVVRHARESGTPLIGTCGGYQYVVLEIARNILGLTNTQHAEHDPYASDLFISELECSLAGQILTINLTPGSKAHEIYASPQVSERYYCNFGINPKYVDTLKSAPILCSGLDPDGEIRIIELPEHPFYVATLFVPQARSTQDAPHPLVSAFIQAVPE